MSQPSKNSSTPLKIDYNIIRNQLLVSMGEGEEPQLTSLHAAPTPKSTTITPKPSLCVKTRDKDGGKVFINVCTNPQIPAPEDVTDQELITIIESDNPGDFRIPMSIGEPHQEEDKSGQMCMAYDIVINPQFLEKTSDNLLFHNFYIMAAIAALEEKYGISLDASGWIVLKNKKYMGQLSEQTIRTTLPLVQPLSSTRKWTPKDLPASPSASPAFASPSRPFITEISTNTLASETQRKTQPKFSLRRECDGEEGSGGVLVAEVELPTEVGVGAGVEVSVGEDRLVVEGRHHLLDIFLPVSLDNTKPSAHFITSERSLPDSLSDWVEIHGCIVRASVGIGRSCNGPQRLMTTTILGQGPFFYQVSWKSIQ